MEAVPLLVFFVEGTLVCLLAEALRAARQRAETSKADAERVPTPFITRQRQFGCYPTTVIVALCVANTRTYLAHFLYAGWHTRVPERVAKICHLGEGKALLPGYRITRS